MAQLGRISGGVLQDNLLRNNVDLNFKNQSGSVPVLKLDVSTRQIGINTTALTSTLAVPNNIRSTSQVTDVNANISDINIQQGQINAVIGNLNFPANNEVHASAIATADLKFDYNVVSTYSPNSNILLTPNGTGTIEIFNDFNIYGNLYTSQNITLEGNITLGNESSDKIILNTDIDSSIIPKNGVGNLSLGSQQKAWGTVESYLLNGEQINTGTIDISGIRLNNLQGNMFYVSLLGQDTNVGDHQQAPVRTIKRALELADGSDAGPITILVFPGEYEEQTPLVIPENVSIKGIDIRNCIVKPAAGYETNDVFKVNDATYIENLTIKDFNYDGAANTGYAFKFADGAVMNSRSPYIQNITVKTQQPAVEPLLTIPNPNTNTTSELDEFGYSIATFGNYTIVGAPDEDYYAGFFSGTRQNTGAAYVIDNTTGTVIYTFIQYTAGERFGRSVDICENYAVVGAPGYDLSSGRAYVYDLSDGSLVSTIDNANNYGGTTSDNFGKAVSINNNYVVVGAPNEDSASSTDYGAAYVFNISGTLLHTLTNPNLTSITDTDDFGFSVAIEKNLDYIVVGAPGENTTLSTQYTTGVNSGVVYVFAAASGNLLTTIPNPTPGDGDDKTSDYFGGYVDIDGTNLIASLHLEPQFGSRGSVSIHNALTGAQIQYIQDPDQVNNTLFGRSVSISGNLAAVGATYKDIDGVSRVGRLYVYAVDTGDLVYQIDNPNGNVNSAYFGNVSLDNSTLVVGSQFGQKETVYVYDVSVPGKGAYIDGSVLDAASIQKSMLFHSATFITPDVDAITMTNDVRVEWLNSFTYFANRGLYAVQGPEGGAEIRSIGSASVYGNIGAEADGADTLMYLIGHNFAYIGVGTRTDNDSTLAIDDNQTIELNSGKIYHTSTDHRGTYRVGDVFFVDFDDGETSINTETVDLGGLTTIQINTGGEITTINFEKLETGNIRIGQNTIQSLREQLDFVAASGETNFDSNVFMYKNLDITGNHTIAGNLIRLGDQESDSIDFEIEFDQDIYPDQDSTYDLGKSYSEWEHIYLSRMNIDNIRIDTNVIQVVDSNSDLEFRSVGTGAVLIDDIEVNDNIIRSINNENLDFTLTNNNNLIIDNTGAVKLPAGTTLELPEAQSTPTLDGGDADDVLLTTTDGGDAATVFNPLVDTIVDSGDSEIIRGTAADIRYNNDYSIFEAYTTARTNIGGGVFSDDRNTRVLAGRTDNILYFFGDNVLTSNINADGLNVIALEVGDIYLDDNVISTNDSNADLELRANGTGSLVLSNVFLKDNIILNTNTTEDLVLTSVTSNHSVKVDSTTGIVIPWGTDAERPAVPYTGDVRWNTEQDYLEVYNGTEYQRATGTGPIVDDVVMREFIDLYTIVLG